MARVPSGGAFASRLPSVGVTLMPRKQCACGCGEWFTAPRNRLKFKNWQHFIASPQYREQTMKGAKLAVEARTKNRAKRRMVLDGFGELSPRELAIYERGRHNGMVFGRRKGYDAGIRKGYADANGEDMEGTWSKARRAA